MGKLATIKKLLIYLLTTSAVIFVIEAIAILYIWGYLPWDFIPTIALFCFIVALLIAGLLVAAYYILNKICAKLGREFKFSYVIWGALAIVSVIAIISSGKGSYHLDNIEIFYLVFDRLRVHAEIGMPSHEFPEVEWLDSVYAVFISDGDRLIPQRTLIEKPNDRKPDEYYLHCVFQRRSRDGDTSYVSFRFIPDLWKRHQVIHKRNRTVFISAYFDARADGSLRYNGFEIYKEISRKPALLK